MQLLIDAHLDIAANALGWDRDQTWEVSRVRSREAGGAPKGRGINTATFPEMRRGGIALCLTTVIARCKPDKPLDHEARRGDSDFCTPIHSCAVARGQLSYYKLMEEVGQMRAIQDAVALEAHWSQWEQADETQRQSLPIGYILTMEGTDPILSPEHVRWWHRHGLRSACLAHFGQSLHAMGTGGDGPLTPAGRDLLKAFNETGMLLDLVHTADRAFAEALEIYTGPAYVSHANCRALVDRDRQLTDQQIRWIIERGGVIGLAMYMPMLKAGWTPEEPRLSLEAVADHADHICQLAGNDRHVALGSDLDGGFGADRAPAEIDTIADLQRLGPVLARRGYSDAAIANIFHGNWLRFFAAALPPARA